MKLSLTDILCTKCGLCCDGSLFADVELANRDEASALEVMGLDIEDDDEVDGELLLQPCAALKRKRCSIYPYRPNCCRTFECRLLQKVKRGTAGPRISGGPDVRYGVQGRGLLGCFLAPANAIAVHFAIN